MTQTNKEESLAVRENLEDIYELSPVQQGMLFHSLYAPQSAVYFEQLGITFSGNLSVCKFEQAWQQAVSRHTILRSAFHWEDLERPYQVVYRKVTLPWKQLDWRSLARDDQEGRLDSFLLEDRTQGFRLAQAPLMRFVLIRLGDDTYRFIWSFHHALLDGWSMMALLKEVLTIYQALDENRPFQLTPVRPYRDYILWIQEQDLAEAESFWRRTLRGFTSPTRLFPRPQAAVGGDDFRSEVISLSARTTSSLRLWARQHQLTLNTLVQGAWIIALKCYSGEQDVVYGTTVSGRPDNLVGADSMIGLFINTLPVRARIDGKEFLLPWLKRLQQEQLDIRQYEYSPLVRIKEWSELPGDLPLFESILVFENYPMDDSVAKINSQLKIQGAQGFDKTNYPLTVVVVPGSQLQITISYDGSRSDRRHIQSLLESMGVILEAMLSNPDQKVAEIPFLSQKEQRRLLVDWNQTESVYSAGQCVHQLLEAQVHRTPQAVAVSFEEHQLTYEELNRRANQLAHRLRRLGVGPEVRVGVCLQRSIDMLVALVAVMKTGGAYLPLDPTYPTDRLSFMLTDAEVAVLLTQQSLQEGLPASGAVSLCLDSPAEGIGSEPTHNPSAQSRPESLVYVIYTSGSTGRPKGVMITHQAVVNFLQSMRRQPGIVSQDVLAAVTTLSFDIAGLELYLPLMVGARLELLSQDTVVDGSRLSKALRDRRVTVMQATPATWRMLLEAGWTGDPELKILCGGEALDGLLAKDLVTKCKVLWNMYGPTETTIWSAIHRIESEKQPVLIGRPIANTQIYILDQQIRPVPVGVAGQLYIGGSSLSPGYVKRAGLTAEKFIPDPFTQQAGSRLYQTGDRARYLPDGTIEWLGRIDDQVKLRGFRIELGEIEARLLEDEQLRQCVAALREDQAGDARLVAYFVPAGTQKPSNSDLQRRLSQKLPGYMIPSAFVEIESVPLTPNGKVNRKALPPPSQTSSNQGYRFTSPRDDFELQLSKIWKSVLKVDRIGVTDSFFDLGGHSLLALRLMTEVEKNFDRSLPLATLFEAPTIEQLALKLRQQGCAAPSSSLVALQAEGSAPPFFCIHSLGGDLFSYRQLAVRLGDNQPFYGVLPLGLDGKHEPHRRIEDMAAHYIQEIQRVQSEGPYHLGGVCLGGIIAFEMARQLRLQGQEIGLLAMIDSYFPGLPSHLPARNLRPDVFFFADYYLGDLLLLPPREKVFYVLTRLKNIALRVGRRGKQGVGRFFPSWIRESPLSKEIYKVKVFNSHAEASYRPPHYPGKIDFFWCSEVPTRCYQDRRMGWSEVAGEGLQIHVVPGNHMTMLDQPHVNALAEKLSRCLRKSQEKLSSRAQEERKQSRHTIGVLEPVAGVVSQTVPVD